MRPIRHLPADVSSRIAAGEVIENPASVVKEMLENSIDAEASRISVLLTNGGKSLISVLDDGLGIPREEMPLAVERFATSKISTLEDLSGLLSFGFRGEALASVCAVSRMEIHSCRKGLKNGGMIVCEGGETTLHVQVDAMEGTRIVVRDLFFNLPARRKFLKGSTAELRKTASVVRDYSAAFPRIAFVLESEGRKIWSTEGDGERIHVLRHMWGSEDIRMGSETMGALEVETCWSPVPGSKRKDVVIFVNGRRVREPAILAALSSCGEGVAGNWFFSIKAPGEMVDVNVHPGKNEVRIHPSIPIFETTRAAVARLVEGYSVGNICLETSSGVGTITSFRQGEWNNFRSQDHDGSFFSRVAEPPADASGETRVVQGRKGYSFIGQISSGYLLFESEGDLVLVDPHAAHERINFEKFSNSKSGIVPQSLPFPEQIPPSLSLRAAELKGPLENAGFRFDERGGSLFITALPEGWGSVSSKDPIETLRVWSGIIENPGGFPDGKVPMASEACRASVRLGEKVSTEEALRLIADLLQCQDPFACPHGRPLMARLRSSDLARLFGRESQ
jgi:DNA mismatch repair protein MutL